MRTLCLLAVLSACLALTHAIAQPLLIKGGANVVPDLSDVSGGFYIGVAKDIKRKGSFSFQPALQYSYQSYSVYNLYGSPDRYRVHKIQMPLNFRFDIGEWFGIAFGPQFIVVPRAIGKYRQDPARAVTSSFPVVNLSGVVGPYFRVNQRLALELRGIVDGQEGDHRQWSLRYAVIQAGVSWAITKPKAE